MGQRVDQVAELICEVEVLGIAAVVGIELGNYSTDDAAAAGGEALVAGSRPDMVGLAGREVLAVVAAAAAESFAAAVVAAAAAAAAVVDFEAGAVHPSYSSSPFFADKKPPHAPLPASVAWAEGSSHLASPPAP